MRERQQISRRRNRNVDVAILGTTIVLPLIVEIQFCLALQRSGDPATGGADSKITRDFVCVAYYIWQGLV